MRVALISYKIRRGHGSEDGSGYNFASQIARQKDISLTLISRKDNVEYLRSDPNFRDVTLIGLDVPRLLTWWKQRHRGILMYYYMWQWWVAREVRRLHTHDPLDVIHQYNFHTDSTPHFLGRVGPPVVWGPICHQPKLPVFYMRQRKLRSYVLDRTRYVAKWAFWLLDGNLRRTITQTAVILYANNDIAWPFLRYGRTRILRQVFGGCDIVNDRRTRLKREDNTFVALHVGRMVPIKGAALAISAFAGFVRSVRPARARLVVVGDGPLRDGLARLIRDECIDEFVDLLPSVNRDQLSEIYSGADLLLYPSLGNQDSIVAEAMSFGLPIIGIADSGTEVMADRAGLYAPRTDYQSCVEGLAASLATLYGEWSESKPSLDARIKISQERARIVSWPAVADEIAIIYRALQVGSAQ